VGSMAPVEAASMVAGTAAVGATKFAAAGVGSQT
jgi:hypothetical protein